MPRPVLLAALAAVALVAGAGLAAADPVAPGAEHCVVNVAAPDRLNLRAGPGAGEPVVARLPHGRCGIIVTGDCRGSWCPAEDGHYAGWAHRRHLAMVAPAMTCVTGVAQGDALNLRAFPSATSRVLARLPPHQCGLAILPYATGIWQKVRAPGWEGWVARRFLTGP